MKKLLLNPYVIVGAVLGGIYLMRKKSDTKTAKVFEEIIEGGQSAVSTLSDTAVSLAETTIDTAEDVFGILSPSMTTDSSVSESLLIEGGEDVDLDEIGETPNTDINLDDEETPTEDDGSGFSGVASKKFSSDGNQMLTFSDFE
tara:strand:- start:385 stop:816 length:432 start_codon:yes stop_codon:yes gene_type:complete